MKKAMVIAAMAVVLTAFLLLPACAEEAQKEKSDMMGMGMKMGMGPKQGMTSNSLVATSDGGIIVMGRGKLMKYDKDLNLIKEVELKTEAEGGAAEGMAEGMPMQGMQKTKTCPMCGKPYEKQ